LIAEALQYPDDFSWVKFKLNPNAKWHDGEPITVDDVIWSFDILKKQSPLYNKYYGDVEKAEKTGDHEVKFTFSQSGNRELPQIVGQLAILPKHWWEGKDAQGKQRDISRPTLEIPLGSAAYKIKSMVPGRSIVWGRVADYWGKDLGVNVGRNNFDEVRYEYYFNEDATWEAFKKVASTIIVMRIALSAGRSSITSQPCSVAMSSRNPFRSMLLAECRAIS
jgi:microcin C transport system substrate-binding protein